MGRQMDLKKKNSVEWIDYLIGPLSVGPKLTPDLDSPALIPLGASLVFPPFRAAINAAFKKVRHKISNWGKHIENSK